MWLEILQCVGQLSQQRSILSKVLLALEFINLDIYWFRKDIVEEKEKGGRKEGSGGSEVKVTQLCLTLCNLMDCGPPGCSALGDFPGKNTEVGNHALLQGNLPYPGIKRGSLHYRWILYCWTTREAWEAVEKWENEEEDKGVGEQGGGEREKRKTRRKKRMEKKEE